MFLINKLLLLSPLILQTAVWPLTKVVFNFFVRLKISGLENLRGLPPGIIFVSNHSSELDPILVPASLPFLSRFMPMFYVSRPKSFYVNSGWRRAFYGGCLFKLWGAYAAVSGIRDYEVTLKPHQELLNKRKSVLIFPEGQKTKTGFVMTEKAKGGAAYLAERTGMPIVPVAINGLYKMSLKEFLGRSRRVTITFGAPIYGRSIVEMPILSGSENKYKSGSRRVLEQVAKMLPQNSVPLGHFEDLVIDSPKVAEKSRSN